MDRFRSFLQQITDERRVADAARRVVFVGIAFSVVATALFLGGRSEIGKLIYCALVALTTAAWFLSERKPGSASLPRGVALVLLAGLAVPLLQLTPLPTAVLDVISPSRSHLLPLWAGETNIFGQWQTASFATAETLLGVALAVAHVALFLVTFSTIRDRDDIRLVVTILAALSAAIAAVGVLQWLVPNGKIMWVYDYVYRKTSSAAAQGPFTSPNHFGHFVALGVGPLAYLLMRSLRVGPLANKQRTPHQAGIAQARVIAGICLAGLLISVFAIVMSYSRGALGSMVLGGAVAAVLIARAGWLELRQVLVGAGVAALVAVMACSFGYGDPQQTDAARSLNSFDAWSDDNGRMAIWTANLEAFVASPWVGYGIGTHRDIYRAYIDQPIQSEFTHAESSYLQIATECGIFGVAVLLTALTLVARWCIQGLRGAADSDDAALWAALCASVVISMGHALVDFVWFIPACLAAALVLAACAARLFQMSVNEAAAKQTPATQPSWALARVVCLASTVWAAATVLPAATASLSWGDYLLSSRALESVGKLQADANDPRMIARMSAERDYHLASMVGQLEESLRKRPTNAAAHDRIGKRCLQLFEVTRMSSENSMTLPAIREAALNASFSDQKALRDWLRTAFGEDAELLFKAHHHVERAVRLNPLKVDAYVQLSRLDFLSADGAGNAEALSQQALRLSPLNGGAWHQEGLRRHLTGDMQGWLDCWKKAINLPGEHRQRMVTQLACCVPAQVLIGEFQIDWDLIQFANHAYQRLDNQESLRQLATYALAKQQEEGEQGDRTEAAFRWRQVSAMQLALGDTQQAIHCAQQACDIAPQNFQARFALVHALIAEEDYSRADPHLRWCAARRPDIISLQNWLKKSARQRLAKAFSGPPAFSDTNLDVPRNDSHEPREIPEGAQPATYLGPR